MGGRQGRQGSNFLFFASENLKNFLSGKKCRCPVAFSQHYPIVSGCQDKGNPKPLPVIRYHMGMMRTIRSHVPRMLHRHVMTGLHFRHIFHLTVHHHGVSLFAGSGNDHFYHLHRSQMFYALNQQSCFPDVLYGTPVDVRSQQINK